MADVPQITDAGADLATAFANAAKISASQLALPEGAEKRYQSVPTDACNYGKANFWDDRYARSENAFEWYHPYPALAVLIGQFVNYDDTILIMGCGNSTLPEDMYNDGYERIVCVDLSRVVIDQQQEKYADLPIQWVQMNMCDSLFENEQFDAVIDKACLDAIYCHELGEASAKAALQEVDRILKPEGVYFMVSRGLPEERLEVLEVEDVKEKGYLAWQVQVHAIAKPAVDVKYIPNLADPTSVYYIYVCEKDEALHDAKRLWLAKLEAKKRGEGQVKRGRTGRGRRGGRRSRPVGV
uniref:Methyltransferase type 11 domain-containing protein n=1 Tax=Phaeomonas parva TaxID=124430 RepID=A0A7S1UEF3_9STRA|mmetsp:Transcript_44003/g.138302  ORF Transcript_44003/g.138302 Transcript_44003/m.138302 type:complete len:297 (+) Transcript_44003:243-1133(+)